MPGLWAVIPVKSFDRAKTRLAPALSPGDRSALAEAMFLDVLATVCRAGIFDGVAVVTDCPRAAALARAAGARAVPDRVPGGGTNSAVMAALDAIPAKAAAMIVQTDLPLLRPADLVGIAAAHAAGPGVTLVPALDGGTTILTLSGARPIRPAFGGPSHARHMRLARAAGITAVSLGPATAVCDLDRPADLPLLLSCPAGSRSAGLAHLARPVQRPAPVPTQESDARDERVDAGYAPGFAFVR